MSPREAASGRRLKRLVSAGQRDAPARGRRPGALTSTLSCCGEPPQRRGRRFDHGSARPRRVRGKNALAVLQQERDEHLGPALVLRVRGGEGGREVPFLDGAAVVEVRSQHRDDDSAVPCSNSFLASLAAL